MLDSFSPLDQTLTTGPTVEVSERMAMTLT